MRGTADLAGKASGQRRRRELERHSGCYLEFGCGTVIIIMHSTNFL